MRLDICVNTFYSYVRGESEMRPHTRATLNRLVAEMEANYAK